MICGNAFSLSSIAHFLCGMHVLDVRGSSSFPRLPLCQILFFSQLPLLS